ncbi:YbjN domain-containing protein [Lysobacter sp. ESA13C]|uniref:YbjN domain-containing protein n=1 Tax=unclassified Lysobacter TaxID=2635362 RepID=UPI001CC16190|nr:YbjN domain-containing protein [Lysobacter sp. ESA13C]
MRLPRYLPALLFSLLPVLATAAPTTKADAASLKSAPAKAEPAAAKAEAAAKTADPRIGKQLDALGYKYEVDKDGDYTLTFGLDEDRSQMAYVISHTERYGKLQVREVWSPGYRTSDKDFPAEVANRLLEDSQLSKMGGWVKQDSVAVFVVKLDADASQEDLDDAIDYVVRAADEMESQLTPGQDEF